MDCFDLAVTDAGEHAAVDLGERIVVGVDVVEHFVDATEEFFGAVVDEGGGVLGEGICGEGVDAGAEVSAVGGKEVEEVALIGDAVLGFVFGGVVEENFVEGVYTAVGDFWVGGQFCFY